MKKILFSCSLLLASLLASADTAFQTYYPKQYVWANRPTCGAAITGMNIMVTDVGPNWWEAVCDGTRWVPVSGRVVIQRFMTPTIRTGVGSDSETVIGSTWTVPAGLMLANSIIRWSYVIDDITNSANNKTMRLRMGTTSGSGCTGNTQIAGGNNTSLVFMSGMYQIYNQNSVSVQSSGDNAFHQPYNTLTGAGNATAFDFSSAVYGCLTIAMANTGETLTVKMIDVVAEVSP